MTDLIQEMKCKNCVHCKEYGGDYYCDLIKEAEDKKVELDHECKNGLFEGRDFSKDLKEAYEDIVEILRYYVDLEEPHYGFIAIWIIGTYFHKDFNTYPYLFLNAMRGSGKTRLLKLIARLSKDGQLLASLTEAVLFRTGGTLCLDEFEGLNSKNNDALRELLNTAYKKGTKIFRMKKKKGLEGTEQVVESFEPYRPIALANIWGMEEVLGDRCITLILEKSDDKSRTQLIENFDELEQVQNICTKLHRCSLCRCSFSKNIAKKWNEYIKETTLTTTTTTTTTTTLTTEEGGCANFLSTKYFKKIFETGIDGRHLELFLPLFLIATSISDGVFEEKLHYAQTMIQRKKSEEITESKDVMVYKMVAQKEPIKFYGVKDLTNEFRLMMGGGDDDWLNSKWMGRALRRLNLVVESRRMAHGVEISLDIPKAEKKIRMFE